MVSSWRLGYWSITFATLNWLLPILMFYVWIITSFSWSMYSTCCQSHHMLAASAALPDFQLVRSRLNCQHCNKRASEHNLGGGKEMHAAHTFGTSHRQTWFQVEGEKSMSYMLHASASELNSGFRPNVSNMREWQNDKRSSWVPQSSCPRVLWI